MELILTVDANSPGAPIREGFVPAVLNEVAPKPDDTMAVTCGPPIMIEFGLQNLAGSASPRRSSRPLKRA